ncbi:transcriptional repressor [Undibacterium sp. Jales W-56]|uniref:Fur family transcriptional regulator n=1 Tax=Undibacterium sp. Jales W-56 TaxID=2897325 RepID=UPI0021D19503|nr:transcriptional repressor [Undibacterium sp. Jales W-56]MCU6434994.1 transcriptional repressor [Undibacterium sp. Jales W-56]
MITAIHKKSAPARQAADQVRSLAERMLSQAAIRVTEARTSVLTTLLNTSRALSHQEVQDTLPGMDRVTLYRALDCLTDAGLAHKIAGDDRIFRYNTGSDHQAHSAMTGIQHQHGHFKCTRCAKVFCLDEEQHCTDRSHHHPSLKDQLQATLQATLGKGFQSHDIELTIKGWCAECAK